MAGTVADRYPSVLRHRVISPYGFLMPIAHEHNLDHQPPANSPFGIRVKLRSTDPFKNLIGQSWSKEHWFATREERDEALKEMSGRYVYFRPGDKPSLDFEKVDRP